jgi:hypothetical protein
MSDALEFVKVTSVAVSTSTRAVTMQAAGAGAEGDDNDAERFDEVEVVQPLGVLANPILTDTTQAVAVRHGDELVALFIVDKGRSAQAIESGETRLYGAGTNNQTTVIRLRASGAIEITSANNGAINITANGTGDVVVNGGSLKLARVTDPVRIGTVTGTAGPYPVVFTTTLVDADGTPGAPTVGNTATLSGVVSNAGGASRAKG